MARLEADEITNEGNTSRPNFPKGLRSGGDNVRSDIGSSRPGGFVNNSGLIPNGGTLTVTLTGSGPSTAGIAISTSTRSGSGLATNKVHAFGGRDDSTPTQLHALNTSTGAAFNISHSNNAIILTNTSGVTCNMACTVFFTLGY